MHRLFTIAIGIATAAAASALLGYTSPLSADTFELHCDEVVPDQMLGIQQNYEGGDCLPGPPGSPGNLLGLAFPFNNTVEEGSIVGVRLYFVNPSVSTMNLYLWPGAQTPRDSCGVELYKQLHAPIQGEGVYSDYTIDPPIPMPLGARVWVGAIYESASIPPAWALGRISGPSQPGRSFGNVTGDHGDWFDLHEVNLGQCFGVRIVITTNRAPVAEAGPPACGNVGTLLTFDGRSSSDPDGDTIAYHWDFGDGATATGATVSHSYAANGSYPVILTVNDASAVSDDTTFAYIGVPFTLDVPADVTLARALEMATSCQVDTIRVAAGIYQGPFVLRSPGVAIVAPDGPAATQLVNQVNTAPVLNVLSGSPSIEGFRVQGNGIGIRSKATVSITSCEVIDCGDTGIVLDATGCEVDGCLVAGNSFNSGAGGGIDVIGSNRVVRSTIHGNGGFAIRCQQVGPPGNQVIDRCILSGTGLGQGLVCLGQAAPVLSCNDLWGNGGGNENCGMEGGGNFSADPLFCDADAGDFQLFTSSPCLNRPICGTVGAFDQGCGFDAVGEDVDPAAAPAISFFPPTPNPFVLETHVTVILPEAAPVRLIVNDVSGRRVRALPARRLPAGTHRVTWNGKNDAGEWVASGTYLLRLEAGARIHTERVVLLH